MNDSSNLTPPKAVLRGHLVVTLPVLALLGLAFGVPCFLIESARHSSPEIAPGTFRIALLVAVAVVGFALAWLWWSVSVPRWREWAKAHGADEQRTHDLAVRTSLVWPKGSIFGKTEIPPRKRAS